VATITAGGNITRPLTACFFANRSSNVNNATGNGTVATIVFNSVVFNQGSYYASGTGLFSAPVAGKYLFTSAVFFDHGNGATSVESKLVCTGRTATLYTHGSTIYSPISTNTSNWSGAAMIDMAQNDTAKITFTVTGLASDLTRIVGGNTVTWFSGKLIC